MQYFRQNRANRERLAPVFHNGKQSENSDNSCPNGEPTFTVNASAEDHLASKKGHAEGTVTCRMPNKKVNGSAAVNQVGNGRGATVSKAGPDNGKGMERSPNDFQNQQRPSTANSSASQPAAATRSTHESTAKIKSHDSKNQPKQVMMAAAKRINCRITTTTRSNP